MRLGHYFLAINIEAICPLETFKENAGNFLRFLRGSTKDPQGPGRIWTGTNPLEPYPHAPQLESPSGMPESVVRLLVV
jgi:hypothetical protein